MTILLFIYELCMGWSQIISTCKFKMVKQLVD